MDCRLYLTYRTEYLMLGDLCVGVRDRRSSQWLPLHAANCSRLLGTLASREDERWLPSTRARPGEHLCMEISPRRLITGPVVAIERAGKQLIEHAEAQWRSLFAPTDVLASKLVLLADQPAEDALAITPRRGA